MCWEIAASSFMKKAVIKTGMDCIKGDSEALSKMLKTRKQTEPQNGGGRNMNIMLLKRGTKKAVNHRVCKYFSLLQKSGVLSRLLLEENGFMCNILGLQKREMEVKVSVSGERARSWQGKLWKKVNNIHLGKNMAEARCIGWNLICRLENQRPDAEQKIHWFTHEESVNFHPFFNSPDQERFKTDNSDVLWL